MKHSLCLLGLILAPLVASLSYKNIGEITSIPNPSFQLYFPFNGTQALWVTSFSGSPFTKGAVYVVPDVAKQAAGNISNAQVLTVSSGTLLWPNEAGPVPSGAIPGLGEAIYVPDGFLVPGHSNGGIYVIPVSPDFGKPIKLSQPKSGYFYHRVRWIDMNGDGRLDILTARATKPLFSAGHGELLWLEQPATNPLGGPWTEHVLTPGPDILFIELASNKSSGEIVIAASEFFGKKLSFTTVSLRDGSLVSYDVIDSTLGPGYKPLLADLDGDGETELVVSNHKGGSGGQIYAYLPPTYKQRVLLSQGYKCVLSGFGVAAPGMYYVTQPTGTSGRPYMLVAGDGSAEAYLLSPANTSRFAFSKQVVQNVGGTVGAIGVLAEQSQYFFVPYYEKGRIFVYTFY